MFFNVHRSILRKRKDIGHRIWLWLYIQDNPDWTPEGAARDLDMPIAQVKQHARELAAHGSIKWQPEIYKHARRSKISRRTKWLVWNRDDFRCKECGSRIDLTVDHVKPVTDGGTDDIDNLQTLCRSCNSSKGVG